MKKVPIIAPSLGDLALFTLGLCLLIWADKVTSFISIAIGGVFLLYSAYILIAYLRQANANQKRHLSQLVIALALAIAGLFLIIQYTFLKELVSFIVGFFIVLAGILKLQDAIASKAYNPRYKLPVYLALLEIICGVFCLIGRIIVPDLLLQLIGGLLVVASLSDLISGFAIYKAPHSVENQAKEAEIVKKSPKK